MNDVLSKVFTSSKDPSKVSLFVKGTLISFAPIIMVVLGVNADDYTTLVNTVESLVFLGASIVGPTMTLFGLLRKVYLGRWSHPDA